MKRTVYLRPHAWTFGVAFLIAGCFMLLLSAAHPAEAQPAEATDEDIR